MATRARRLTRLLACTAWLLAAIPGVASAQVRISPGPLSRPHAALEGITNCSKCHGASREMSPEKCLSCHKPIAERVARKTGVHRAAGDNCARCHIEHRGVDAELRRIQMTTFDHAAETGFALAHRHAALSVRCDACHKQRSFLTLRPACSSCHADVHKATLGLDCTKCHSTEVPFKETRRTFDHTTAAFQLAGAHRTVRCEKCHAGGVFRGLKFESCASCHQAPHRHELGPACTTCHTLESWKTRTIEHVRTGFALVGAHATVACEKCHVTGVRQPLRSDKCAACHANVHRESIKEDCRQCHTESGFKGARFDHATRAGYALTGKHDCLACRACHKNRLGDDGPPSARVIDFGGASPACVTCHADRHKGEYGRACDACHRPTTFKASGFTHPRMGEFFAGRHTGVACVKCHVRPGSQSAAVSAAATAAVRAIPPLTICSTCHADPHLGQMSRECVACHAVDASQFAPARFSHDATTFPLAGRHKTTACAKCHPMEVKVYPAGRGSARRFGATPGECRTCHGDPHLGQVPQACAACHTPASFKLLTYRHAGMDDFFGGFHGRLPCRSCHKVETGKFPAGPGTALRLRVGRTCASCHPYVPSPQSQRMETPNDA